MLTSVTHRRPFVLLAAALLVQILMLAVQIRRPGEVRLIRVWAVEILTPLERAAAWTLGQVSTGWNDYVSLHQVRRENAELRKEIGDLRLRNAELESRAAEAQRLAGLLSFREAHPGAPLLTARVIGAGEGGGRTLFIDRGERDGVKRDMGVITPEGVVGKILEAFSSTAQVLLITDRDGGVGSLLAGTRTQGVAKGQGEPLLLLSYVNNDETVTVGEQVLTSGIDRIFPKDLPVGTVVAVRTGNPFKQIEVRPAAHLDRVEEVFVLLSRADWETPAPPSATSAASGKSDKAGTP